MGLHYQCDKTRVLSEVLLHRSASYRLGAPVKVQDDLSVGGKHPLIRAAFRKLGLEIRRAKRPSVTNNYYDVSPSCQIPNLSFLYERFLGQRPEGMFVEVGAFDGISYSNSSCLADAGWGGLLIEPVPEFAQFCRARYAGNEQIRVVECAVGDSDSAIDLMVGGVLTTANLALAEEYLHVPWSQSVAQQMKVLTVPQARLDSLLTENSVQPRFDVLVVDVEGFESAVFAGFSLDYWRPKMMIVELCDTHPDLSTTRTSDAALSRAFVSAGYEIVFKDSVNTMFVDPTV